MGKRGQAGSLDGSGLRIAVVAARFNSDIVERLIDGALGALERHGAPEPALYWVPGSLELPLTAKTLATSGEFDAICCLGCVIKGETAHFEHVGSQSIAGLVTVTLATGVPCSIGVLTTYDRDQALARSGPDGNKGAEAAETAIEMASLLRQIRAQPRP
jgi:6,7-dimethyl-8-ribityllumazine synthase